jgi:peptide/nickel transport system substrate-binding protein
MITRFIVVIVIAAVSLASCAKPLPSDRSSKHTRATGDSYIASSIGDASYLNPVLSSDSASAQINGLIFNGLVKYDKNLAIVGDLAERWSASPDGLTLTFHLRKNIIWHDGAPFTAEDVIFTYDRLVDPRVKTPFSSDYEPVKTVTAVDPYTVRVVYRRPFAPAIESWMMGIIPKHVFGTGDFNTNSANRKPIGTGPFIFKEWKTDEKIVLTANPKYFEGQPPISRYVFRIIPDQSVQFLELRNESIDEDSLTPDQWLAYPEFFKHYNKFNYPSYSYTYLGFNLKLPLFSDKRLRQAIGYAINKKEIIDGVLLGKGRAATGPFPPQSWAYDQSVKDLAYDPARARTLLAELGWIDTNGDGYLEKSGKPLAFTILTNQGNKMRMLTAEIIQAQLKKVGIKAAVRVVEWSSFVHQFIDKHNFEVVMLGWSLSRDPDQYALWHSNQTHEGQYNFISYNNTTVDKLLENGRTTYDQAKRKQIYNRIHRIMADDLPCIFLYYPESLVAIHNRFRGPEVTAAGIGWNFHKWWVPVNEIKYKISYEQ